MKKIIEFKWRRLALVVFIMLAIVAFTGNFVTEVSTRLGKSELEKDYVYTYLSKEDATVKTPVFWARYMRDDPNGAGSYVSQYDADMIIFDNSGCVYMIRNKKYDFGENADFAGMNATKRQEVADYVSEIQSIPLDKTYVMESEIRSEYLDVDGEDALRTSYKMYYIIDKVNIYVRNYTFLRDGKNFDVCVWLSDDSDREAEELYEYMDYNTLPYLEMIEWGDVTSEHVEEFTFGVGLKRFDFPIWVFLIMAAFILLCSATYISGKNRQIGAPVWQNEPLGLDNSKNLLGFFALMIVLHHIAQAAGSDSEVMGVLENLGVCFVAGFFFFSGYGLVKSYMNKKDYLKGFFRKRLPGVLIPAYICSFIYIFSILVFGNYKLNFGVAQAEKQYEIGWLDFIEGLFGIKLFNTQHWYIVEIVVLYTIFFFMFRFIKNKKTAMGLMLVFLLGLTVGSLFLGHGDYWFQGEWWYNSTLIFWVGMLVAMNETKVEKVVKSAYTFWLTLSGAMFILFYAITKYMLEHHGYWTEMLGKKGYDDKFLTLVPQLIMSFFFIAFILILLFRVRFDNIALRFFGKISLELYLIHNVFIQCGRGIIGNGMYAAFIIFASVLLAALLFRLDTVILCRLNRKKIPKLPRLPKIDITPKIENIKLRIRLGKQYIRRHPKRVMVLIARNAFCILLCAIAVIPIYFMIVNSTLTRDELVSGIHWFPGRNFMTTFSGFKAYTETQAGGVAASLFRSCFISGTSTVLAVYFGAACAYGFELFDFKGKKVLWKVIIVSLMFSSAGSAIGYQKLIMKYHMLNTYIPLIIPAIATPSVAYFMRMYLRTLKPKSIVEAARIDGCSEIGIFNRIIVPMTKPALSLLLIFNFVSSWNNSFTQSLVLTKPEQKTIALYLRKFASATSSGSDPFIYMLLVVATIPPLVVYLLFAKSIVSRIAIGAVKE